MTTVIPPSLFATWQRPAPLMGVALCAAGYWLSTAILFVQILGPR